MKKIISIFLIFLCVSTGLYGQTEKIAMVIAKKDFRDEELSIPKSIFENAGFEVIVFSDSLGKAKGMLGAEVLVDSVIDKLNPALYEAVIFVGGAGASGFWEDKTAHRVAEETLANNRVLGAICIAPVTLANAGVLNGKQATVWSTEGKRLIECGADYTGAGIEVDGNIVTGNGPEVSKEFAETILGLIQ